MSELNASNLRKEHGNEGPDLVGVTELTSPYYMVPPSGNTKERPENPEPGTLRFNTDSGSLEYFKGDTLGWESIDRVSPNLGGGTGSNTGVGARGIIGGGFHSPGNTNVVEYFTIPTLGDAQDFGDLTRSDRHAYSGVSSRTRGCFGGGFPQSTQATIDYITISSPGNALDFGDLSVGRIAATGVSNQTRGCYLGGYEYGANATRDTIDYITIATTGNAKDFGNLLAVWEPGSQSSCNSSTRGIAFKTGSNTIQYITIATTGDSVDFGDAGSTGAGAGLSNSTRGIIAGGGTSPHQNAIEYLTIATLGNTSDFGDLNQGNASGAGTSSPTRGVISGMKTPSVFNTIEYITIATIGNAKDFGDLTAAKSVFGACSNAHGGL